MPAGPVGAWSLLLLALSVLVVVVVLLIRGRQGRLARDDAVSAFEDWGRALARVAEEGEPIHIAVGSGAVSGEDSAVSLAGLRIAGELSDAAVALGRSPVITVGDATLLPLAQDALRRVYAQRGIPAHYDPEQVRFVAPGALAYAAGAGSVAVAQNAPLTVVVGSPGSEATLITDPGLRRGSPQFVAVASATAGGATYPVTDQHAPGEGLFATAALETRDRRWTAALIAQDILRLVVVVAILAASLWAVLGG
jgi:hypothetical protein